MILNLISLSSVKLHLGIASVTHDTAIAAMIPVVSSDIRRILNCSHDKYIIATFSTADATIILNDYTWSNALVNTYVGSLELGQVVYHANLPADTYLQSFDPATCKYTLSATPTGTGEYVYSSVNIAMFPTIAKMVWYRISKMSTTDASAKGIQSESYGSVSITYSDSEINAKYNYPQILIDDLGVPFARVG
jgi:hypothetical protein